MKMRSLILSLLLIGFSSAIHSQSVYKTPSGKKYHLATCRMITNTSQEMTLPQALESGLDACKICNPPGGNAGTAHAAQGQKTTTTQCKGITKAGSRCKHMTRIANGYCAQHNPG
jgi:hypothetical protein